MHQLKDGMTAKCGSKQELRAAINAIHEKGVCSVHPTTLDDDDDELYPWIQFDDGELGQTRGYKAHGETYIPLHEFILRGMGMWVQVPKVMVAGNKAIFSKGSVKIGCTTVTNDEVREAYKHLID